MASWRQFEEEAADLTEAVLTSVGPARDAPLIETWRPGEPSPRYQRWNATIRCPVAWGGDTAKGEGTRHGRHMVSTVNTSPH